MLLQAAEVGPLLQLLMECSRVSVSNAIAGQRKAALRSHLHADGAIVTHDEGYAITCG